MTDSRPGPSVWPSSEPTLAEASHRCRRKPKDPRVAETGVGRSLFGVKGFPRRDAEITQSTQIRQCSKTAFVRAVLRSFAYRDEERRDTQRLVQGQFEKRFSRKGAKAPRESMNSGCSFFRCVFAPLREILCALAGNLS